MDRRSPESTGAQVSRGLAIRLFFTCWLIYALHFATNTVREIYPALSLGDHLSFNVSEYVGFHPDIFELPGGEAFINNNPGASVVGAIPYVLTRPLIDVVVEHVRRRREAAPVPKNSAYDSPWPLAREFYRKARERGLDVKFGLAAGVMQAFAMAPLSALGVVVMFYILLSLTDSARTAVVLALLFGLATPILYRSAQLNQNMLVTLCALFAFAALWRPWDKLCSKPPRYFLAGALCGWAVVCDYSGLIVVLVLGVYGLVRRASLPETTRSATDGWRFVAGLALSGSVLIAYQWSSFGHPVYPAQHYMAPAHFSNQGYQGMDWPQLDLLWMTAFDKRFGLFTSAPLLLLSFYIPGWFRPTRLVAGREAWCVLIFSVAFFIFCSANQYGRMQFNSGVRHVVPVTPFLFLIAAGVLVRLPKIAAVVIGLATTYWSWCLAMYRDVEIGRMGVLDSIVEITLGGLRFPWLTTLERLGPQVPHVVNNRSLALPILLLVGLFIWAIWSVGRSSLRARPTS